MDGIPVARAPGRKARVASTVAIGVVALPMPASAELTRVSESAKSVNGRIPSQAQERGVGGETAISVNRPVYWTLAPTTLSQPLVIAVFIASCSSSVGKTATS